MTARHAVVYWFPAKLAPPRGLPVSRQWSLPEALSKYLDVILLSAGGSSARHPRVTRVTDTLWLLEGAFGLALSAPRAKLTRALLPFEHVRLDHVIRSTGHRSWTMWLSAADPAYVPFRLPPKRLVYDCIDPPFQRSSATLHADREREVIRRAGITFITAAELEERVGSFARTIVRLPNACHDLGPLPPYRTEKPVRVGYLGTIDWRFSIEHVATAAEALPDCRFVLGGRVNANRRDEVDAMLRPLSNVDLLGTVPEEDGKALIESFDVGLVPFTEDTVGDSINPVKMYSYLERGVTVVATDIRECRGLEPYVIVGPGTSGFVSAIRAAFAGRSAESREACRQYALQNTWDQRARTAIAAMEAAGIQLR